MKKNIYHIKKHLPININKNIQINIWYKSPELKNKRLKLWIPKKNKIFQLINEITQTVNFRKYENIS